ncbi:dicer-like protein 1 [Penicillium maclennaniae]|uniref:dicer-like protein 1 n=1 Tax=Penicillium maclennaniae TaxID=1343394 RepID=UPI0025415E52|nr:dicer-like protein 1 [Penicillium maclennaniae]KAJ5674560.1 dicer-like protein 1 [Penicillium maclennaniae]
MPILSDRTKSVPMLLDHFEIQESTEMGPYSTNESFASYPRTGEEDLLADVVKPGPTDGSPQSPKTEEIQKMTRYENAPRRRLQNAQFEALIIPQEHPRTSFLLPPLLAKHDHSGRNLDPREYQIELFERAKKKNIIAVLDTGSGKTLIAVLLLKHVLNQELIDRDNGNPPRVAFFLVDSVTLVFQQSAVLRNNLDQDVAHIFGAMGPDFWDSQVWGDHLARHMVIVCTAEILNHALLNGFVKMVDINLLIFDEAHHTKKDHVYARIIRDSYLPIEKSKRPRILGMTASPIDAKVNIAAAATRLEKLLDSEIATTSNLTLLRQVVRKPEEETWTYNKLDLPFPTELYRQIERGFGNVKALKPILQFSLNATSELGTWCADQVWEYAVAEDVLPKLEGVMSKDLDADSASSSSKQSPEEIQKDIMLMKEACHIVRCHQFKHPSGRDQLSPKVELFIQQLFKLFATSKERKCIVFTQRRNTAKTLVRLCEKLDIPNLRPGVLVGIRDGLIGSANFSHQLHVLAKFRQGEVNCLFATSVAEEGLDIPDCNLVVRFDLYNTLIQYIQSRGRARNANSIYATMVEMGNEEHKGRLQEVHEAERLMQAFCRSLPADRIVSENDHDVDITLREEKQRIYTVPSSGAKLTYAHAINILEHYATSLQCENDLPAVVSYALFSQDHSFICEIILPEKSPIRGLIGNQASTKGLAKRSAAFDTCLLLRNNGLLDDNFRSRYHKRLPAMRNAKLSVTKKVGKYIMICKPSIWNHESITPDMLYGLLINFTPTKPLNREHQSLLLLSRKRLPSFPTFSVFLENDVNTIIQTEGIDKFVVTSQELKQLSSFTLAVFQGVFHKSFDPVPEKLPCWLAPVRACAGGLNRNTAPKSVIDWETVAFAQDHSDWKWSPDMDVNFLLGRFMYDPWDGRKRYFPIAVETNLHASDSPPDWTPRRRWMENIANYSLSLPRKSRSKFFEHFDWSQPVLQVECLWLRRNFLDKATDSEKSEVKTCVVCPQTLAISSIPLTIVTSCLAFPAIISRLESYMIVIEGCKSLNLDLKTDLALESFTKDSNNTEGQSGIIKVQRGMGKNYERLEFLGDCFLKLGTTISLFAQKPDNDEYDYHVYRMCLICNKNLFNTAIKLRIHEYIRSRGFSRNTWYPPGLTLLHGRNYIPHIEAESSHNLSEKSIADVCEALIAASLLSCGKDHRFDLAVQAITLLVNNENHTATRWADYLSSYTKPTWQLQVADAAERDLAKQVFQKLGYRFKFPRLLRSAFTHPSFPLFYSKVPCYQRLEFLGDALLDMVCIEFLYHRYPDKDPQWLTEHKMAMVSNKFLGALAVRLSLHQHLQYVGGPLQGLITHYAEDIQIAEAEADGAMDYWLDTRDSPKCLADMIEAYTGAIFVDSEFDFTVVETFFTAHMRPFFEDMSLYDTFANKHPTTFLHAQLTNVFGCTNYCLKTGEIPEIDGEKPKILATVMVHGHSIANAVETSGRYAKVRASEQALVAVQGMLKSDFQLKYGCGCGSVDKKDLEELEIGTAV